MIPSVVRRLLLAGAILAVPGVGYAQEAVLTGTVADGQQFQNTMGGGGQPTFSQEMIAEFQFISNRFDATQAVPRGCR